SCLHYKPWPGLGLHFGSASKSGPTTTGAQGTAKDITVVGTDCKLRKSLAFTSFRTTIMPGKKGNLKTGLHTLHFKYSVEHWTSLMMLFTEHNSKLFHKLKLLFLASLLSSSAFGLRASRQNSNITGGMHSRQIFLGLCSFFIRCQLSKRYILLAIYSLRFLCQTCMQIIIFLGSLCSNPTFLNLFNVFLTRMEFRGGLISSDRIANNSHMQYARTQNTCPFDPSDKYFSNGKHGVQWIHWIQWTIRLAISMALSIGSIGSNGHFRLAISLALYLHDVHVLLITSLKYMVIDQLKKQMSDGNSTCPLDPMDKQNSNGQIEIHLTNGMSNGLFIFPSDILHGYWTLIINGPLGRNSRTCRSTNYIRSDHTFMNIMENSIRLHNGHYEIALPWKNSPPHLPNTRRQGVCTNVFSQSKPDKIRVVFDCAAVYHGTSLNDQLLQGPDLTNNLVGVLIRFRQEPVALMADIESMFHQVNVRHEDCDALRFLWWPENDLNSEPKEFQMLVHLFWATSSPSCANFALLKTADDNSEHFDAKVTDTVRRNFYVDDCLKSVGDDSQATVLVVASLPESERAASVKDLCFDKPSIERALGVLWDIGRDEFGFRIKVKDNPPTGRGILSIISSVYDPLGFVCPFVLLAKIIMQDLCRKNLGWDDPIQYEHLLRWKNWQEEVPKIEQLRVPRCFKPPEFGEIASSQLHHSPDASQRGYGAVSYLRLTNQNAQIHCSFVMGKARLAPLKETTIPRLELSAAVVATRLDKMIRAEIDIPIDTSLFWTDSTCVIGYIANEDKRFQTFVANRVASIREVSSPSQWKYVSTQLNPADDASRGLSADELISNTRWLSGPDFLWKSETHWPTPPNVLGEIQDEDMEVKREVQTFSTDTIAHESTLDAIFKRFSSTRLVDEIIQAEKEIMRYVQRNNFQEELSILSKSVTREDVDAKIASVKKSSPIHKLDPKLSDNLLCVGGRLRNAPIPSETKHPFILPKNHHISILIAQYYHLIAGHSGLEHALSLMREKFWLIGARATLRRVLNKCVDCSKRQAPVGEQKMADLPEHRVTPDRPPFTFVGVDCFGPFVIKRGRKDGAKMFIVDLIESFRSV
ncbi:Hypothetical predicted protein, partial [Paramuricea clavata]